MYDNVRKNFNPYEIMSQFYRLDNPTEEEQFMFVEAMDFVIQDSEDPGEIEVCSYNLAMYYRDIKNFQLEKKYLEICLEQGSDICKEALGMIWYNGYCGEQDYEKAYHLFSESDTRRGQIMIADMFRYGQYVAQDEKRSRDIIEELFVNVECERHDKRFRLSTLFPEIAYRLARYDFDDFKYDEFDLDCLIDAREILAYRQKHRPYWENIKTMKDILELIDFTTQNDGSFFDLYDLLIFDEENAIISFLYGESEYRIEIFRKNGDIVYQFGDKWFHDAMDFLEKARIEQKRITSVYDEIEIVKVEF